MNELVPQLQGPAYVKPRAACMDSFLQPVKPSHRTLPCAEKCPGITCCSDKPALKVAGKKQEPQTNSKGNS